MKSLSQVLADGRAAIVSRWMNDVRAALGVETLSAPELADHVPLFIDTIAATLQARAADSGRTVAAKDHGEQRLRLGFSVGEVVKEYSILRHSIMAEAESQGVVVQGWEFSVLADCITDGIEHALSEYSRERDAELQRHMNEHFAFVAHELRNPLSTARLSLETLRRRKLIGDHKSADALDRSLKQTADLIEHFLRVARVQAGYQLRPAKVSLLALLQSEIAEATPHAEDKDIRLKMELEKDVEVVLDPRLIHSALDNGVRNAIKFTPPGGSVTVRGLLDGSRVTLEVEDCCGGISEEDVSKAFNPFVQFNADKSGFGLGLAIAKQAMDAHGGTVRIQNLPGHGCKLIFELPLAQPTVT